MKRFIPHTAVAFTLAALALPLAAFADNPSQGPYTSGGISGYTFAGLVQYKIVPIINAAIPLLASIAIIIFFWGVIRYIASSGGAKEHVEGRRLLLWGIIALFVLFSIWGIIGILKATFFP